MKDLHIGVLKEFAERAFSDSKDHWAGLYFKQSRATGKPRPVSQRTAFSCRDCPRTVEAGSRCEFHTAEHARKARLARQVRKAAA